MRLFEHQAKALLRERGVPVPEGRLARTAEEAVAGAESLGGDAWVVKAQVLAGGRGKAGGVRLCRSLGEVRKAAQALIGARLVTPQTGPEGEPVEAVWVEKALPIAHERYLAVLLDRELEAASVLAAREGGMSVEEIARRNPEALLRLPLAGERLAPEEAARVRAHLDADEALEALVARVVDAFWALDAMLVEINPLAGLADGRWIAADAKIMLDDNAAFRHPEWTEFRLQEVRDPLEARARSAGLNYIALDGDIGCMVNGAGLAMATMDLIALYGGRPANFLDVGGGVSVDAVAEGFRVLFAHRGLRAILVNIFGGIVRCDWIAEGLIQALAGRKPPCPIVLRLVGTNEAEGKRLVAEAGISVRWVRDLDEAARAAVEAADA